MITTQLWHKYKLLSWNLWINLSLREYLSKESNILRPLGGQMLENYFNYKKHKTDFKTEVIAGTTTFLTMAYIMFLNPFAKHLLVY